MGESGRAGISALSHRVSVRPSATAEHTALDSSARWARRAHTRTNTQGHSNALLKTHKHSHIQCTHTHTERDAPMCTSKDV